MYKVILQSQAYWDEETRTHLTNSNKTRIFSDEFIENNDMSNIESAIDVGVLKKVEIDKKDKKDEKENVKEETIEEENEVEDGYKDFKKVIEEEESKPDEDQCQATTTSGEQCRNEAKYPEDDPKYCGVHKKLLDEDDNE